MVFFPIFASTTPRSQEMIESAFIPILRTITTASLGSPEADIIPKEVLTFLIEHTKPDINKYTSKVSKLSCSEAYRGQYLKGQSPPWLKITFSSYG